MIKGLTDRPAALPEIGAIRKGAEKPEDGKRPGADLKYFRVVFDERETESIAVFQDRYGKQPTEINILFPFNEVERNFEAWRESYGAGALLHRCNGEQVLYEIDPKTGEKLVINGDPFKACSGKVCKPVGRMKVIIPELARLAYLVVHTTSIHDIINLSRQLEALRVMNGGRLAGIPLKLRRRPVKISTPSGENGKRARREKWLLSVEADPEWVARSLIELKRAALPGNGLELKQIETSQPEPAEGPEWDEDVVEAGEDEEETQAHPDVDTEMQQAPPPDATPEEADGFIALHWRKMIRVRADDHPSPEFDGQALAVAKRAFAPGLKQHLKEAYGVEGWGELTYAQLAHLYSNSLDTLAQQAA